MNCAVDKMCVNNPQKRMKKILFGVRQGYLWITFPHRHTTAQGIENTKHFAIFRLLFQAGYGIVFAWK